MHVAFAQFCDYCRKSGVASPTSRFSAARLSITEAHAWPEFKGKAAMNRHVTQWVYSVLPADSPVAEVSLFWGLSEMLHLVHNVKHHVFDDTERQRFVHAGRVALQSYAELSRQAAAARKPLWPIKPKHHQLDHQVRAVARSGRVPAWCFSDEDFNRIVVRVVRHCRSDSLGKVMLFKWALRLYRGLEMFEAGIEVEPLSDSEPDSE